MMNLSVVIVNWNSGEYLTRVLKSLDELRGDLGTIWVVDNASEDSNLDKLGRCADLNILRFKENLGFAGAANEGISQTHSEFVMLLNPDVEVNPRSVRLMYKEIELQPDTAIVCGALTNENGETQRSFQIQKLPTWKSVLLEACFVDHLLDFFLGNSRSYKANLLNSDSASFKRIQVEQSAAAFWLLRRKAWDELGGFDSTFYPAWFEDVDFCKRLQGAGWKIFYFPNLPLIHRGRLALQSLSYSKFVRIFYGNLLKYLRKHHPRAHLLLWLPVYCGMWIRWVMGRK